MARHISLTNLAAAATALVAIGCGAGGEGPQVAPIEDQVVAVGQELVVHIDATQPNNLDLAYHISPMPEGAWIGRLPTNAGEFRWTPTHKDVGEQYFDLEVSDGSSSEVITFLVDVRDAVGANTAPRFIRPAGMGTTLDLSRPECAPGAEPGKCCVDLQVEIADDDSSSVEITQASPEIEHATLQVESQKTATWHWCPRPEQLVEDDRHTLMLEADDGENPKTLHPYLIVFKKPLKLDCPGTAPTIQHAPSNRNSVDSVTISVEISDDLGLREEPLLMARVAGESDFMQMTMRLTSGDNRDGTWTADLPNPVVSRGIGAQAEIDYFIVAEDDDDPTGDCDHRTESSMFKIDVTNPGSDGDSGTCEVCSMDTQCAGADGMCVRVGTGSDAFCLATCDDGSGCPTGYSCSAAAVESVEGQSARVCVPDSGDCSDPSGTVCADDDFENNDARSEAFFRPLLEPGSTPMVSCPARAGTGDDEDWVEVELETESMVTFSIDGSSASDLDLAIYDDNGIELDRSGTRDSSSETISRCLAAGYYTARVMAFQPARNPYTITYSATPGSCGADAPICTDDGNEDDDSPAEARFVPSLPHEVLNQAICGGDADYYNVFYSAGERAVVDLFFDQNDASGDLDVHLYDENGIDLTPCSPADVSACQVGNGQSGSSDEHFEMDIPSSGVYYVVIQGYAPDNHNDYDIQINRQ